ncbi:MAG: prepilin-type N-terminal cleavage/methylation domain-containing protein, partial [bacterium]|nr:prepilin-type N-terminal cleavage/methylation domain-containing protein [bacterium]
MRKKGFTIVELLVYCGLLAVLLTVLTNVFMSIINLQLETESSSGLAQDSQYLLSRLTYDFRRANSISSPILGGTSGTLTIIIGGVTYQYKITDGNLVVTPGGQLNSFQTKISNLSFSNLDDTVQVHFTMQSGRETRDFSTT